jgi:hypothetical protein
LLRLNVGKKEKKKESGLHLETLGRDKRITTEENWKE